MEMPRLFTLEEANALLPRVRQLIESMQAHQRAADEARQEFEQLEASHARHNGYDMKREQLATRITEKMRAIRQDLEALHAIGCQVKDLGMGLVDFTGLRDGQVVNLCWMLGEDEIKYWHPLNTGFADRRPL
jgi:hypothetical protein